MKFSAALPLFLSALAIAAPIDDEVAAADDDKPSSSQVKIRSVRWNGSGCPYNGVQSILNPDATIITLLFNNYTASIGKNVPRSEARKNCQVSLDLQYPQGYQYSVADVTVRGYIDIDEGITATVQSRYYFQGAVGGKDAISRYDISRKFSDSFSKSDGVPFESLVWSPCGAVAAAQINNEIRLVEKDGYQSQHPNGIATVDSLDAKFTQKHYFNYALRWKKSTCGGRSRVPAFQKLHVEESTVQLDA